jgi:hypothetical protein
MKTGRPEQPRPGIATKKLRTQGIAVNLAPKAAKDFINLAEYPDALHRG